jgi:hypothetical protein
MKRYLWSTNGDLPTFNGSFDDKGPVNPANQPLGGNIASLIE